MPPPGPVRPRLTCLALCGPHGGHPAPCTPARAQGPRRPRAPCAALCGPVRPCAPSRLSAAPHCPVRPTRAPAGSVHPRPALCGRTHAALCGPVSPHAPPALAQCSPCRSLHRHLWPLALKISGPVRPNRKIDASHRPIILPCAAPQPSSHEWTEPNARSRLKALGVHNLAQSLCPKKTSRKGY